MFKPASGEVTDRSGAERSSEVVNWRICWSVIIGIVGIALVFLPEIKAATNVWNESTAYSHCYLVLPMAIYLLWDRRSQLAISASRPAPIWAIAALPVLLIWIAAERLGFMEGRQLAVVAGFEVLMITVVGRAAFIRASGPLLFLFFLVPVGAFATPLLQRFTASFSIIGLDLLGIPNYSDRFTIETPAGTFFVAEACAGLRFLVASVTFGVFYALLSYTSLTRRFMFIACSAIVPIIANGFRALGIVVLGQILGSAEAAAADHLIYGWIFFSAVMLMLILVGQMFRDVGPVQSEFVAGPESVSPRWAESSALCVVVLLLVGPAAVSILSSRAKPVAFPKGQSVHLSGTCSGLPGVVDDARDRWHEIVACGGMRFDVSVNLFSPRSPPGEIIALRRRAVEELSAEDVTTAAIDVPPGTGLWTLVQTSNPNRTSAYATWVNGAPLPQGLYGRLEQGLHSVLGSSFASALVLVTTTEPAQSSPGARKRTLDETVDFIRAQSALSDRIEDITRVALQSAR